LKRLAELSVRYVAHRTWARRFIGRGPLNPGT
jgi:hypothetical protein